MTTLPQKLTYEYAGPFNDGSFKVIEVSDTRRVVCEVSSGSLEQNAKDAELIVGVLNHKESK